jgi:small ligand-binding sensory domain FIST
VTTGGLLGAGSEVEDGSALALWAVRGGSVETFQLPPSYSANIHDDDHQRLACAPNTTGIVLFSDELTFSSTSWLAAQNPSIPVAGAVLIPPPNTQLSGRTSSSDSPSPGRPSTVERSGALYRNGKRVVGGGLAIAFGPEFSLQTLVAQTCRPIGSPFTVTKAERNVIYTMGGLAAATALDTTIDGCTDAERALLRQGIHLGIVSNTRAATFGVGDFVVHHVLGADRNAGAIAITGDCSLGDVVQFHVRDSQSAQQHLAELVIDATNRGAIPGTSDLGAFVFASDSRGSNLFGTEHHDSATLTEFPELSAAGIFCSRQIGPAGPTTTHHLSTLTMTVLRGL